MIEVAPPMANANGVSDVLHAVASLAWPSVVLIAVLVFRSELADLIRRIRSVKAPGGAEIQIGEELKVLEAAVEVAADSVSGPNPEPADEPQPPPAEIAAPASSGEFQSKVALLNLASLIERRSRDILASRGPADEWEGRTLYERITRLDASPPVAAAALQFEDVRKQILRTTNASPDDIDLAIKLGQELLRVIERIPHEVHYVREPRVELFADAAGNTPFRREPEVHGVLLESVSSEGGTIVHAFPTTLHHFEPGRPVSWEWGSREFGEAWYRDPVDGDLKYGWTSSLEFRGRLLDSL